MMNLQCAFIESSTNILITGIVVYSVAASQLKIKKFLMLQTLFFFSYVIIILQYYKIACVLKMKL